MLVLWFIHHLDSFFFCSEYVAVKVVRRVQRYVEDALVEVDILVLLLQAFSACFNRLCGPREDVSNFNSLDAPLLRNLFELKC